jgi:hypothetical protein
MTSNTVDVNPGQAGTARAETPPTARAHATVRNRQMIRQLRALLQLTQTEAQIARLRTAQARTDAVRRELSQNADNAERRSREIIEQLRALGGVPDAVTPVIGRFVALLKSTIEQAEPFDEALLQDLALEHQLLARARYLRALTEATRNQDVRAVAERLEEAHAATVDWISTVLAEEAIGGPAALRPTPVQRVAGGVTTVIALPVRAARESVNRAVDRAQEVRGKARDTVADVTDRAGRVGDKARETVADVADRAMRLAGATGDVARTGRDASLRRAETLAREEGATRTAETVSETREELGALTERELPISDYDNLNQPDAIRKIKELKDAADLRAVVNYEEAHRNRPSVVSAAQTRVAELAKDTAGP